MGKKKTTTTTTNPDWVNDASRGALADARNVASVGYTAYEGDRVAQLSQNERAGNELAANSVGQWQGGLNEASNLYNQASASTADMDLDRFKNPYMQGALDVGDRELTKQQDTQNTEINAQFAGSGSLGNSRRGNVLDEVNRDQNRATVGMTKNMNKANMQGALGAGLDERGRKIQGGDAAQKRTSGESQNVSREISQLYGTGENGRKVEQAFKDFDYTTYQEGKNWDVRNLNNLMKTVGKVPHDKTTTTKTEGGSSMGAILGLVGAAVGFMAGGVAGAKTGAKIGGSVGGAIDG